MIQALLCGETNSGVQFQRPSHQVLGSSGDNLPRWTNQRHVADPHLANNLAFCLTGKRRVSREQQIQNYSARPDITGEIVPALHHLWRYIQRSAHARCHHPPRIHPRCTTVMHKLHPSLRKTFLFIEQDGLRLEIPVANSVVMHVRDCFEDLLHHDSSISLRKSVCSQNSIQELAASRKFQNEVKIATILEQLFQANNVGMIQQFHYIDHALETLNAANLRLSDTLQSPDNARCFLSHLSHTAPVSCPNFRPHLVDLGQRCGTRANKTGSTKTV
mmetsp:Transcript_41543/g.90511  ORF Transcript_41543/g.90511 Transcript_41543/m.90511 type:complete len:274 (+) Transcript_41543:688-1509(+)